jgi:hypothetical protein
MSLEAHVFQILQIYCLIKLFNSIGLLEKCPSRKSGISKVVIKNIYIEKCILTEQHTEIKTITYLCLIAKVVKC